MFKNRTRMAHQKLYSENLNLENFCLGPQFLSSQRMISDLIPGNPISSNFGKMFIMF